MDMTHNAEEGATDLLKSLEARLDVAERLKSRYRHELRATFWRAENAESDRDNANAERDDYEQRATALEEALGQEVVEKKAERERADALAAHVEFCDEVIQRVESGPSYLCARQYRALRMAWERKPATSLARRDARMKAEARRDEVESIISVIDAYPDRCSLITMLRERSAELRRQAEGDE